MVCSALPGVLPDVTCLADPRLSTATAVLLAAGLVVIAATVWRGWRAGARHKAATGGALGALALVALAVAAGRPAVVAQPPVSEGLVAVVLDESESLWREPAAARSALALLAERVQAMTARLDPVQAGAIQAQVIGFAETGALRGRSVPLAQVPEVLRRYSPPGNGRDSRADAGLRLALQQIQRLGRGMILLLGDGQFDDAPDEIAEAAAAGVPIHVLAAGSRQPSAGLLAADIGPEQTVGAEAVVRATLLGPGAVTFGPEGSATTDRVTTDRPAALRGSTRFAARGLRATELRFDATAGTGQSRLLYTLVRGPARVLVLGPGIWTAGLDPARWSVTLADPAAPPDPAGFDLVVVDALAPADLPPGFPDRLLAAADGTGLLLVNGRQRGATTEPQRISDWNATALSPILPVDSDPRKFVEQPPPRDVVVMIDISGSMSGAPLASAVAFAQRIVDQLRPIDKLTILPFADGAERGFGPGLVTPEAATRARRFLSGLSAGGGTSPGATLGKAASLASSYCAYFFLSDGGFSAPGTDPRCYTTVVAVGGGAMPSGVSAWGDIISLPLGSGVGSVNIPYFKPKEREEFFRPGSMIPRASGRGAAMTPALPVPGLAITYPRADAVVANVHATPPPDPLYVERFDPERPGVATGAFLSDLDAWGRQAEGLAAIDAMLTGLTGWGDPDRYDIRVRLEDGSLVVSVTLLEKPDDGGFRLSGRIAGADGAAQPLYFAPGRSPGTLVARTVPRFGAEPAEGLLILSEPDRDEQRIPLWLPARGQLASASSGAESLSFGVNLDRLEQMARQTGGSDLRAFVPAMAATNAPAPPVPLHAYFIVAALVLFCASLWLGEARP